MKSKLHSHLLRLGNKYEGTGISKIPAASTLYDILLGETETDYIIYDGFRLYCPPSETVRRFIEIDGGHETHVKRTIEQVLRTGDVAIDLGAHYGHHTLTMANAVGDGIVYAFEPHPETAEWMERTFAENGIENVRLERKAATDESGIQTLSGEASSVLRSKQRSSDPSQEFDVEGVRLSSYLEHHGVDSVDLLKIDIEGGEYEVFVDLERDIKKFNHILLELHPHVLDETEMRRMFDILSETGTIRTITDGASVSNYERFSSLDTSNHILWRRDS